MELLQTMRIAGWISTVILVAMIFKLVMRAGDYVPSYTILAIGILITIFGEICILEGMGIQHSLDRKTLG